jgi:glutamate:GABA antiporter
VPRNAGVIGRHGLVIDTSRSGNQAATGGISTGGKPGAIIVSLIGIAGTSAGIYYTFTLPFSPDIAVSTWETTLGVICAVVLVAAGGVYIFGRRSGQKLSDDQRLAHLATLEAPETVAPATPATEAL